MSYWQDHGILAVLVDGGFFNNINHHNYPLDLEKVFKALNPQGLALMRNYYYDCKPYVGPEQAEKDIEKLSRYESFLSYVQQIPQTECKLGRLQKIDDTYVQKGVDTLITIDIVTFATKHLVTHLTLLTGDDDLIPAIQAAKNEGIIVTVYTTKQSVTSSMRASADVVHIIDDKWLKQAMRQQQKIR